MTEQMNPTNRISTLLDGLRALSSALPDSLAPADADLPALLAYAVDGGVVRFEAAAPSTRELALAYAYRWFLTDPSYLTSVGSVQVSSETIERLYSAAFSLDASVDLSPVRSAILRFAANDPRDEAQSWAQLIADIPLSRVSFNLVDADFKALCDRGPSARRTEPSPCIYVHHTPVPLISWSTADLNADAMNLAGALAVLRRSLAFLPMDSDLAAQVGRGCGNLAQSLLTGDGKLHDKVIAWTCKLALVQRKSELAKLFDGMEPPPGLWDLIPSALQAAKITRAFDNFRGNTDVNDRDLNAIVTSADSLSRHLVVSCEKEPFEIRILPAADTEFPIDMSGVPTWMRANFAARATISLCQGSPELVDAAIAGGEVLAALTDEWRRAPSPLNRLRLRTLEEVSRQFRSDGLSVNDAASLEAYARQAPLFRLVEAPSSVDLEAVVLDDTHPLSMGPVDKKGLGIPQNDAELAAVELLPDLPDAGTIPTAVADASLELLNAVQSSGSTWRLLRPTSDRSLPVIAHKKCGVAVIVPMQGLAVRDPISGRWMSTTGEIDVAGMLAEARETITSTAKLAPECVRAFVWFLDAVELCDPAEGVVTGKASDVLTAVAATLGRSPAADEFLDDVFQRFIREDEDRPKPAKRSRVSSLPKGTATASPAASAHPGVVVLPSLGKGTSKLQKEIRQEWDDFAGREVQLVRADDLQAALRTLNSEFPHLVEISTRLMEEAAHQPHVRFRPLLLVGKPGAGKSHYAKRVGEVLGTPWKLIPCGGMADGSFGGTSQQWNSGRPSVPLATIRQTDVANPLLILDELEKAGQDRHNGSLLDVLLAMLEPSTSTSVTDPYLEAPVDLSHVTWIATVNHLDLVPGVLYDRFRVIEVPEPGAEHLEPIARSMVRAISNDRGIPEAWVQDLDGFELRAVADVWKGGSLRKLRRVLEAVLTARDKSATRH